MSSDFTEINEGKIYQQFRLRTLLFFLKKTFTSNHYMFESVQVSVSIFRPRFTVYNKMIFSSPTLNNIIMSSYVIS